MRNKKVKKYLSTSTLCFSPGAVAGKKKEIPLLSCTGRMSSYGGSCHWNPRNSRFSHAPCESQGISHSQRCPAVFRGHEEEAHEQRGGERAELWDQELSPQQTNKNPIPSHKHFRYCSGATDQLCKFLHLYRSCCGQNPHESSLCGTATLSQSLSCM